MSAGSRLAREVARSAAWLVVVVAAVVLGLALLDAVPRWWNGEDRDLRTARSLEDAERSLRSRLVLPGYFPDTIAWPPKRIGVLAGHPPSVVLEFSPRAGGAPRLVIAQTVGAGAVPERLLHRAQPLDEVPVAVAGNSGALRRIVGPDGEIWRELAWSQDGHTVIARSKGTVDELLLMARSARVQP